MYGSPGPLWNQDEKCIQVFYETVAASALTLQRRSWPRQYVSRVALIFSSEGIDGDIYFSFPKAPEITDIAAGIGAPRLLISTSPQYGSLIIVEKVVGELIWSTLIANTHRAFQIVVIGAKGSRS